MSDDILEFYNPTHIYFGSYENVGDILEKYGFHKIVIFIGGKSLEKSGRLEKILNIISKKNIEYKLVRGIKANPDVTFVKDALNNTKNFNPEMVLAIGGGSVIDAAKSYANSYYYDGDPIDLNKKKYVATKALPVGTIVTIAASGSEMSSSCVISDSRDNFKGGFNSPTNYPLFSILDSTFNESVPKYQLACGAVDIISHSFERYFCPSANYEVSDLFALSVIKSIVNLTSHLFNDEKIDHDAYKEMLYTSTLSHNGITSFGKKSRMICHYAEHKLSGNHPEIAHGQGLAWLMPKFLMVNKEKLKDKIYMMGSFVFNVDGNKTIETFENYLKHLPLEMDYTKCGISKEEMEKYFELLRL